MHFVFVSTTRARSADENRRRGMRQGYLAHVKEEVRVENEMVEKFVREQMGVVEAPQVRLPRSGGSRIFLEVPEYPTRSEKYGENDYRPLVAGTS